jgi:ATP-dependent DNA ligase
MLRTLIPEQPSVLLYANHIERDGVEFFRLACERDLEGIVARLKHWRYGEGWFKIRNPGYSQREGRRELFERKHDVGA